MPRQKIAPFLYDETVARVPPILRGGAILAPCIIEHHVLDEGVGSLLAGSKHFLDERWPLCQKILLLTYLHFGGAYGRSFFPNPYPHGVGTGAPHCAHRPSTF